MPREDREFRIRRLERLAQAALDRLERLEHLVDNLPPRDVHLTWSWYKRKPPRVYTGMLHWSYIYRTWRTSKWPAPETLVAGMWNEVETALKDALPKNCQYVAAYSGWPGHPLVAASIYASNYDGVVGYGEWDALLPRFPPERWNCDYSYLIFADGELAWAAAMDYLRLAGGESLQGTYGIASFRWTIEHQDVTYWPRDIVWTYTTGESQQYYEDNNLCKASLIGITEEQMPATTSLRWIYGFSQRWYDIGKDYVAGNYTVGGTLQGTGQQVHTVSAPSFVAPNDGIFWVAIEAEPSCFSPGYVPTWPGAIGELYWVKRVGGKRALVTDSEWLDSSGNVLAKPR